MQKILQKLSVPEYIVLQTLRGNSDSISLNEDKVYLKELAEKMQISIRQTSKIVRSLKDKGFVSWSHDGVGEQGTYVNLTNTGMNMLLGNERLLKEYYGRIIKKLGYDNLAQMLNLMSLDG